AEDGIRDFHVTGVQTCALPISSSDFSCKAIIFDNQFSNLEARLKAALSVTLLSKMAVPSCSSTLANKWSMRCICKILFKPNSPKIGRASCRERDKMYAQSVLYK